MQHVESKRRDTPDEEFADGRTPEEGWIKADVELGVQLRLVAQGGSLVDAHAVGKAAAEEVVEAAGQPAQGLGEVDLLGFGQVRDGRDVSGMREEHDFERPDGPVRHASQEVVRAEDDPGRGFGVQLGVGVGQKQGGFAGGESRDGRVGRAEVRGGKVALGLEYPRR